MPETSKAKAFPVRADVERKIADLVDGKISRAEAESWADKVVADNERRRVTDWPAWEALQNLKAAALMSSPTQYFHGEDEFKDWLSDLRSASGRGK